MKTTTVRIDVYDHARLARLKALKTRYYKRERGVIVDTTQSGLVKAALIAEEQRWLDIIAKVRP